MSDSQVLLEHQLEDAVNEEKSMKMGVSMAQNESDHRMEGTEKATHDKDGTLSPPPPPPPPPPSLNNSAVAETVPLDPIAINANGPQEGEEERGLRVEAEIKEASGKRSREDLNRPKQEDEDEEVTENGSDVGVIGSGGQETDNGIFCDESSCTGSSGELSYSDHSEYKLPERELNPVLPDTVTQLDGPYGGKVYLVGTAHFSQKSQVDVEETIRKTLPNVVVLELCESRLSILSLDEKTIMEESKTLGFSKMQRNIKEFGFVQGVMYMLLLSLSAHLTKELGMAPGGEFRRAFREAKKVPGCVIHLGDRPVHVTLRRAISSLSVWQKLKLGFGIIFNNESISKEEVERCKQRDLLEEMLAEMTGEFPALSQVFVDERDLYLTYSIQLAASPVPNLEEPNGYLPAVVVAVVGIGHVPGIIRNWGKVKDSQIPPLLKLPQQSLTSVLIVKGIRYSAVGLLAWGCYRLFVPNSVGKIIEEVPKNAWNFIQRSIASQK